MSVDGFRRTWSFLCVTCLVVLSSLTGATALAKDIAGAESSGLGSIDFPNSGAPEAQTAFLTGVKALHSFEFYDARGAFREARAIDPGFALAYWGEALSHNFPLWAEQDREAALSVLGRYAPTPEARAARTPPGRERGLMEAADVLFGPGDKLSRDIAYSEAMRRLYEAHPDDDEVATLYAVSLLGTVRRGEKGLARRVRAGTVAMRVFARSPNHPGAAHYIIHAFDDPAHAILALPAARAYARIAPAAPHALHMPSHIFVQLGMWEEVVASNGVSYKAALEQIERKGAERGRSEAHALQWYHYGQLQLGNEERARWALDEAMRTLERFPTPRVRERMLAILARHTLETERWSAFDDRIPGDADRDHTALQLAAGLSAAHGGDIERAETALTNIRDARRRWLGEESGALRAALRASIAAVDEKVLEAGMALARGDDAAAETILVEATVLEGKLNPPTGAPLPMKSAYEMYGEFLLARDRKEEAAAQFTMSLRRMANRSRSVRGLERAR